MGEKLLGDELILYIERGAAGSGNFDPVALATSSTLGMSVAELEAITKGAGGNRESEAGTFSWNISFDSLASWQSTAATDSFDTPTLIDLLIAKTTLTIRWGINTGTGNVYYSGTGILVNGSVATPAGQYATGSWTFNGSGALTKATVTA